MSHAPRHANRTPGARHATRLAHPAVRAAAPAVRDTAAVAVMAAALVGAASLWALTDGPAASATPTITVVSAR